MPGGSVHPNEADLRAGVVGEGNPGHGLWQVEPFALAVEGDTPTAGRIWGGVETGTAFVPGGPWPRDPARLRRTIEVLADAPFDTARLQAEDVALEDVAAEVVLTYG